MYALDRRPHLTQACSVGEKDADPARVAELIFDEIRNALWSVTVKWTGAPARLHWKRERPPVVKTPGWFPRVYLPKAFPCPTASVVWCGETALAGKTLCVEFALTEDPLSKRITGFSYRYDLVGAPYEIAVAEPGPPEPAPPPPLVPETLGGVRQPTPLDSTSRQINS